MVVCVYVDRVFTCAMLFFVQHTQSLRLLIQTGNTHMYMTSVIHYEKRHYPYDLELDTKYREYTANNLQKMQNSGALNYKDDQMRQTQSSGEKMNQIQTLDHHGRKRHVKAKTALLQNGTVPGSKVIDYGKVIDSAIVQEGSVPLHKNDSVDSLTNDSQQDDFSFTLPKPQNIAPNKVNNQRTTFNDQESDESQ